MGGYRRNYICFSVSKENNFHGNNTQLPSLGLMVGVKYETGTR